MQLKTKYRREEAIAPGARADWIPKRKLKHFLTLFMRIMDHHQGYEKARQSVGIKYQQLTDLYHLRRLSALNGKRILDEYNRIKGA